MPSPTQPDTQPDLFAAGPVLPEGMRYEAGFLHAQEEARWIAFAQSLALTAMNYKGYTARRRVKSWGGSYDFDANRLEPAEPIPAALLPLRDRAAAWLGISGARLTHALLAEYSEGTPLGWHRDVPDFEDVIGISLLSPAVMRFRPYPPVPRAPTLDVALAPRSIYLLHGPSRWEWQHSVRATASLRYSITFRTRR